MTKRVERKGKRTPLIRFLSGLFVGGVLLFQGTGFITSNLMAEDPTAQNRDVSTLTEATDLSDAAYNYGLYGSPLGQTIHLFNRVSAVVGKLTDGSTSLNPAEAVSMTVNGDGQINIGLNAEGANSTGYLYVTGPWNDMDDSSSLTAASGSTIKIGSYGALIIGYDESSDIGTGTVTIQNGATLDNGGAFTTSTLAGVAVLDGSVLNFGSAAGTAPLTDFYSGVGTVRNFGTINVYNGADGSDSFIVSDYIDKETEFGTGNLTVKGDALLGSSALTLNGTVQVDGNLDLSSGTNVASAATTWASTSVVKVGGLVSVYDDNSTIGSNLSVLSTSTTGSIGGLWVKRFTNSAGTATGGALTVGSSSATTAVLNIAGLENKFNADGTQSAEGLYDVHLGYNLNNYAKINLNDADGSGIIFTGASSYTDSEGKTVAEVVGFSNGSAGTITAAGDLNLYGIDSSAGQAGHGTLSMTNAGTMTVKGDLAIASSDGVAFTNSKTVTAGSMTVGENLSVTNAAAGTFTATKLTLNGGDLANSGTFNFTDLTLTKGNLSGTYTGTTAGSAVNVNGSVTLTGNTGFTNSATNGVTVMTLTDEGEFSGDSKLTFTKTKVINSTNREGDSAFNVKEINFASGSSYEFNGTGDNILNFDAVFDAGSTLSVSAADPLYIAAGKTFTTGSETEKSTINVDLSNLNSDDPLITLIANEDGTSAAADINSNFSLTDNLYYSYAPGTYSKTLVKTSNDESNFNIGEITMADGKKKDSLFFTRQGRISDDRTSYLLDVDVKGFSSFAETQNEKNVAEYLDKVRVDPDQTSEELGGFLNDVMGLDAETDPNAVNRVLNALSGANRANAMMLAMSDPWQHAFNQMGWQTHRDYTPQNDCSTCRGQMEGGVYYEDGTCGDGFCSPLRSLFSVGYDSLPNTAWAAVHTTSFNARDDDNCDKYGITRTGVSLGYDIVKYDGTVAGFTFDYSQPYLYSSWEDVSQHVDQTNFNIGFYGRRDFWNGTILSVYVGGGLQQNGSKRRVNMDGIDGSLGINEQYKTNYDGQSLAAAVQLAKDMSLYNWMIFRPLVQFDTQQVWLGSGSESGEAIGLAYDKSDWNRSFIRAGFETEKNTQFTRFTSRFLYASQISGDSAPEMTASFVGDQSGNSMTVYGVDLGKSYFNAGLGALGYLDCDYRLSISGNYDFAASEKSTAHTGSVALNYAF